MGSNTVSSRSPAGVSMKGEASVSRCPSTCASTSGGSAPRRAAIARELFEPGHDEVGGQLQAQGVAGFVEQAARPCGRRLQLRGIGMQQLARRHAYHQAVERAAGRAARPARAATAATGRAAAAYRPCRRARPDGSLWPPSRLSATSATTLRRRVRRHLRSQVRAGARGRRAPSRTGRPGWPQRRRSTGTTARAPRPSAVTSGAGPAAPAPCRPSGRRWQPRRRRWMARRAPRCASAAHACAHLGPHRAPPRTAGRSRAGTAPAAARSDGWVRAGRSSGNGLEEDEVGDQPLAALAGRKRFAQPQQVGGGQLVGRTVGGFAEWRR